MQLPTPVYKPAFNVTRASHLVSRVSDIEASRDFYCGTLGLVVSDEDADTLWLRGLEEGCHHSLVLKKGEASVERVGMRVLTEDDLDLLEAHFRTAGFPTAWVEVAYQGRTLQTTDPAGTPLEFCTTMDTRPRLFANAEHYHGACALRLDHFQIVTPMGASGSSPTGRSAAPSYHSGQDRSFRFRSAYDGEIPRSYCETGITLGSQIRVCSLNVLVKAASFVEDPTFISSLYCNGIAEVRGSIPLGSTISH